MANPMDRSCVCDEELSTVHVLSCKKMRGLFVRHDVLRDVLKKICVGSLQRESQAFAVERGGEQDRD